jgi:hypothetical protein
MYCVYFLQIERQMNQGNCIWPNGRLSALAEELAGADPLVSIFSMHTHVYLVYLACIQMCVKHAYTCVYLAYIHMCIFSMHAHVYLVYLACIQMCVKHVCICMCVCMYTHVYI